MCAGLSHSVVSDSVTPWSVAYQAPLSVGTLQARTLEWVAMPSSRDLPSPGIEPRSPTLQADSLPSEPPGKPKNTGAGSLSLSGGTSQPKNQTGSQALQADSSPAGLPGKPDFYNGSPQSDITLRHLFTTFQTTVDMCLAKPAYGSPKQQA